MDDVMSEFGLIASNPLTPGSLETLVNPSVPMTSLPGVGYRTRMLGTAVEDLRKSLVVFSRARATVNWLLEDVEEITARREEGERGS